MAHVIVVGCGQIGSHVIPHLARVPAVDRVTLIDRDHYEAANMANQAIDRQDVGKPKARVQAARLRRIRPDLRIDAYVALVEDLPLGVMRCDLILGCLDSRIARMHVNQSAWRLGVPWLDAGVETGSLLVRVNAYMPSDDQPCLECAWSSRDYDSLEWSYPCSGSNVSTHPANRYSGLGALAASLQIMEAQKLLSRRKHYAFFGSQILMDTTHHKHYLTAFRRNPRCRFDHDIWKIEDLPEGQSNRSLGDVLQLGFGRQSKTGTAWLQVERMPFARRLVCPGCSHSKFVLRLRGSLSDRMSTCVLCSRKMWIPGWDLADTLTSRLPLQELRRSLKSIGLRNRDIITVGGPSGERHFEIIGIRRTSTSSGSALGGERKSDGAGSNAGRNEQIQEAVLSAASSEANEHA
jgi:hypothetical protein